MSDVPQLLHTVLDAVDVRAAEIEPLGDERFAVRVHAAEFRLHRVQDRQQRPFPAVMLGDDLADLVLLGTHSLSLSASPRARRCDRR